MKQNYYSFGNIHNYQQIQNYQNQFGYNQFQNYGEETQLFFDDIKLIKNDASCDQFCSDHISQCFSIDPDTQQQIIPGGNDDNEGEEEGEGFYNQPYVDRSALLRATLNSLAMNNVASVLNSRKHKKTLVKNKKNENEEDALEEEKITSLEEVFEDLED